MSPWCILYNCFQFQLPAYPSMPSTDVTIAYYSGEHNDEYVLISCPDPFSKLMGCANGPAKIQFRIPGTCMEISLRKEDLHSGIGKIILQQLSLILPKNRALKVVSTQTGQTGRLIQDVRGPDDRANFVYLRILRENLCTERCISCLREVLQGEIFVDNVSGAMKCSSIAKAKVVRWTPLIKPYESDLDFSLSDNDDVSHSPLPEMFNVLITSNRSPQITPEVT